MDPKLLDYQKYVKGVLYALLKFSPNRQKEIEDLYHKICNCFTEEEYSEIAELVDLELDVLRKDPENFEKYKEYTNPSYTLLIV